MLAKLSQSIGHALRHLSDKNTAPAVAAGILNFIPENNIIARHAVLEGSLFSGPNDRTVSTHASAESVKDYLILSGTIDLLVTQSNPEAIAYPAESKQMLDIYHYDMDYLDTLRSGTVEQKRSHTLAHVLANEPSVAIDMLPNNMQNLIKSMRLHSLAFMHSNSSVDFPDDGFAAQQNDLHDLMNDETIHASNRFQILYQTAQLLSDDKLKAELGMTSDPERVKKICQRFDMKKTLIQDGLNSLLLHPYLEIDSIKKTIRYSEHRNPELTLQVMETIHARINLDEDKQADTIKELMIGFDDSLDHEKVYGPKPTDTVQESRLNRFLNIYFEQDLNSPIRRSTQFENVQNALFNMVEKKPDSMLDLMHRHAADFGSNDTNFSLGFRFNNDILTRKKLKKDVSTESVEAGIHMMAHMDRGIDKPVNLFAQFFDYPDIASQAFAAAENYNAHKTIDAASRYQDLLKSGVIERDSMLAFIGKSMLYMPPEQLSAAGVHQQFYNSLNQSERDVVKNALADETIKAAQTEPEMGSRGVELISALRAEKAKTMGLGSFRNAVADMMFGSSENRIRQALHLKQ